MIPLAVFPDAAGAAIDVLTAALTGRDESYVQGVQFGNERPPVQHQTPFVQVAKDDDRITYPILSRVLLRVTVWHSRSDYAHDLAQLCQGLLLCHAGNDIASCSPGVGPIADRDPDTGDEFSTFTVNAVLRSTVLSS